MHYKESWGSTLDKKWLSCHTKARIRWGITLFFDVEGDQTKRGKPLRRIYRSMACFHNRTSLLDQWDWPLLGGKFWLFILFFCFFNVSCLSTISLFSSVPWFSVTNFYLLQYYQIPGADALVIRVVSSVDKKLEVKPRFLEIFQEENYPTEFPYKSKVMIKLILSIWL